MSCWAMNSEEPQISSSEDCQKFSQKFSQLVTEFYVFDIPRCGQKVRCWRDQSYIQKVARLESLKESVKRVMNTPGPRVWIWSGYFCPFVSGTSSFEQFYLGLPPHQLSFQMVPPFPFHTLPMQSAASTTHGLSFVELRLALRMHPDKAHQNGMCQML